jgi:hypothetical protein
VILNLKYGARPAGEVLEEIGTQVLPALAASENDEAPAGDHGETSDAAADRALA